MSKIIDITGDEFRRMQLLELDMLVQLDQLCRKHDIKYVIFCNCIIFTYKIYCNVSIKQILIT